jgi:hypothetical protein
MFDYETPRPRLSVLLFVLQFLAAPLVNAILGFIAWYWLSQALIRLSSEYITGYLAYSIEGFLLGYAVQFLLPRAIEYGGRWIWIPPVSFLTWACIDALVRFGPRDAWDLFWPSEGEAAWGLMFLTLPALSCCFFSIGVVTAHRGMPSIPRSAPAHPAAPESL